MDDMFELGNSSGGNEVTVPYPAAVVREVANCINRADFRKRRRNDLVDVRIRFDSELLWPLVAFAFQYEIESILDMLIVQADTAPSRPGSMSSSPPFAPTIVQSDYTRQRQSTSPPATPASPFELRQAVIGRKEGARMLASEVVRQAQQVANQPFDASRTLPPGASYLNTDNARETSSSSHPWLNMEGSMRELTRQASAEDEQIKTDPKSESAEARQASVDTGRAAGLASPFRSAHAAQGGGVRAGTVAGTCGPPVAGETRLMAIRQRTTSGNSTHSLNAGTISKDQLLRDLAEAVKSERRRNKLYEEEILSAETEIDYITRETANVEQKYAERIVNQDSEIVNLKNELQQIKQELETAYDLDPDIANDMLELLSKRPMTQGLTKSAKSSVSPGNGVPAPKPIIESFDIDALRGSKSSNGVPESPAATHSPVAEHRTRKISKAKRRIDAHVAAHKSDLESVPPKPSLWTRTRRLSRSLSQSKSNTPVATTPTNDSTESRTVSFAASAPLDESKVKTVVSSSEEVSAVPTLSYKPSIKSSKPPVAGEHRRREEIPAPRQRSRSNSFKRGLATTLRVMFPSNAGPTSEQASKNPDGEKVRTWLGETRNGQNTSGGGRSDRVGELYADPFRR
ncbi:hypothetical protein ACM66B_006633 [Microbotryomycetes sp. NB124-2]